MARSLVIGGTLFIGRALVEQLLARGDQVTVMHRGHGTPWGQRVGELRADRNDVAAVRAALAGRSFDVVYDNVYDWERGTTADMVVASARAAALGGALRRYVFTSSVAVFGSGLGHGEDSPMVPADYPVPYSALKAESERALFRLHREEGIPVTTIRPAFIYGPRNPFDREAFFWDRMVAGRPVIVPGDGQTPMQWVLAGDVARASIAAAERDVAAGRGYNLAAPPLTHEAFLRALANAAEVPLRMIHVPRDRIEAAGGSLMAPPLYFGVYLDLPPLSVTTERLRTDLDLTLTPFDEGLRETFAWYRAQQRPRPDFSWEDRLIADAQRV